MQEMIQMTSAICLMAMSILRSSKASDQEVVRQLRKLKLKVRKTKSENEVKWIFI